MPNNRLRSVGDTQLEHDERGQLVKMKHANGLWDFFEWDGFGRLERFQHAQDSEMRYFYDPLGRRLGKTSCAVVLERYDAGSGWRPAEIRRINAERGYGMTLFGWDGDQLAWERGRRAWIQYLYEPGASYVPMLQVRREIDGDKWGPTRKAWYQCDHLGTPMELTDETGKIVWEGGYKAFGEAKATSFDGFTNNIRFQGQYLDQEAGLHYNRHRYYDPAAGRYISKDPIRLEGGLNQFRYVRGNPVKFIDPLGLVDLNLFSDKEAIKGYADKVPSTPGAFQVGAHGNPVNIADPAGEPLYPKDLAEMIRNSPGYNKGDTIELLSCNTGKGTNSFAQQLANELGVNVKAPDQYLWYYSDGKLVPSGMTADAKMDTAAPGSMNTFEPKK